MERETSCHRKATMKNICQKIKSVRLEKEYDVTMGVKCQKNPEKEACSLHLRGHSDYGLWIVGVALVGIWTLVLVTKAIGALFHF